MLRLDVTDATLDLFVCTSVFTSLNCSSCKGAAFAYCGVKDRLCLQKIDQWRTMQSIYPNMFSTIFQHVWNQNIKIQNIYWNSSPALPKTWINNLKFLSEGCYLISFHTPYTFSPVIPCFCLTWYDSIVITCCLDMIYHGFLQTTLKYCQFHGTSVFWACSMILACFWKDMFHANTIFFGHGSTIVFFDTIGIPYDYYTMVPKYSYHSVHISKSHCHTMYFYL